MPDTHRAETPVALKWHRLRRRRDDPPFSRARLLEGLVAGASMEVDLRALASEGFACLHDERLDRETDGAGPVAALSAERLAGLRMRGAGGQVTANRPLTLDTLAAAVRAGPSTALLQLDFKDDADRLSSRHVESFRATLRGLGAQFVLSGSAPAALGRLAQGVEGLRIGFDPCTDDTLARLRAPDDFRSFADAALSVAASATYVYIEYPIILAGLDGGVNIVAAFRAAGLRVDAYTLNTDQPGAAQSLQRLVAAGVDQITTDEPEVLAGLLAGLPG